MYDAICAAIHHELDKLDEKYANGSPMSDKELEDIRAMASIMKNFSTYEAMNEGYSRRERTYPRYDRRY